VNRGLLVSQESELEVGLSNLLSQELGAGYEFLVCTVN